MKKLIYAFTFYTALLLSISFAVQAQIIRRVAGTVGVGGYSGVGGPATAAVLADPTSVALDTMNNLYIADGDNNVIWKVNRVGIITIIAGTGSRGYSGDGMPATDATLNSPIGLSIDKVGNIYFADWENHVVRMINTAGIITTIAGSGRAGYSGDGGPATAARLYNPYATAVNNTGSVYICDFSKNVIRMVTAIGIITTVAGDSVSGYTGDGGPATNAELSDPSGIAVDSIGNLFIADTRNNVIRKVDTLGTITTIAGSGTGGYAGDGGPATAAELNNPWSIGINSLSIYIADYGNSVIRKIDTSGIIFTVAGDGINGYTGDGGLAIYAELNHPGGMAVDMYGDFYFGDVYDFVVREVDTSHALEEVSVNHIVNGLSIYPNPVYDKLTIASYKDPITSLILANVIGETMYADLVIANSQQVCVNVANFPAGNYFAKINGIETVKFLKQ